MIPPLAIIQARLGSTRLKNKMLLEVGGRSLIRRAWDASVEAFGAENVVFALPFGDEQLELVTACKAFGAKVWMPYRNVQESNVLLRLYLCAHEYRWNPSSVIVRVTPDDFRKSPAMMLRVANGERLPVEQGGEAFTLQMLDDAEMEVGAFDHAAREHITRAFVRYGISLHRSPPSPPPGIWTIDTQEDLDAARECEDVQIVQLGPDATFSTSEWKAPYIDPLEGL